MSARSTPDDDGNWSNERVPENSAIARATAILPSEERAIFAIIGLWHSAKQWDRLRSLAKETINYGKNTVFCH
jgi:hypothetical protein